MKEEEEEDEEKFDYDQDEEEELEISDDSDSDSDNEPVTLEEDEDDPDNFAEVQVEFTVEFPKEEDFHGVKNFLKTYIPSPLFNSSELADIIVGQPKIGHMVKVEGNSELFGFFTCVNVHENANKQCIQQIKEFVLSKAGDDKERVNTILDSEGTGILITERLLNVPYQVILPVYRALFANMEAMVEEEKKNKKKRPTFDFDNYLIITTYQQKAPSKHAGKKTRQREDDSIEYSKLEDEYLHKVVKHEFAYPIMRGDDTRRWTLNGVMSTMGKIMIVESKHIPVVIDELEAIIE
eukprot:Phypoly_transcript_14470.p1 GENE.Phypoly_transcript_14470~~Phypoly_transcript_14470.p1  ORF type:complete len:320 (+),score=77.82 Phypoly_transcript_14470:80-961(+)